MARVAGNVCIFAHRVGDKARIRYKRGTDPVREEKFLRDEIERRGGNWSKMNRSSIGLPPFTVHVWATPSIDFDKLKKAIVWSYDLQLPPFDREP